MIQKLIKKRKIAQAQTKRPLEKKGPLCERDHCLEILYGHAEILGFAMGAIVQFLRAVVLESPAFTHPRHELFFDIII